jgi:hypothetical protein
MLMPQEHGPRGTNCQGSAITLRKSYFSIALRPAAVACEENNGVALAGPKCTVKIDPHTRACGWWRAQRLRLRRDLISVAKQVRLLSLLMRRQEVPWPAKARRRLRNRLHF